jgi:hypothetical protein
MPAPANVPAKFWQRDCTFARQGFWRTHKRAIKGLIAGADMLITAEAVARGWTFVHPCKHTLCNTLQTGSRSLWYSIEESKKATERAREAFRELSDALKKLGIKGGVEKEAISGIVDRFDDEEIKAKYGSKAEYEYQF